MAATMDYTPETLSEMAYQAVEKLDNKSRTHTYIDYAVRVHNGGASLVVNYEVYNPATDKYDTNDLTIAL